MTAAKAWTAFVTATAGIAALYGVHVALPDDTTLNAIISFLIPLVTSGATWLVPNKQT